VAFCQVNVGDQKKQYVSDIMQDLVEPDQAKTAFARFVDAKYHEQGYSACGGAGEGQMSVDEARAYQVKTWARNRTIGYEIIETGWTHTAAEAHFAYLCIAHAAQVTSTGSKNFFVRSTDVIEIPVAAENELNLAWQAELKHSHPELYIADQGCSTVPAEDAAARQKRLETIDESSVGPNFTRLHVPFSFTPSGRTAPQPQASEVEH
jgi:hypothetical protein